MKTITKSFAVALASAALITVPFVADAAGGGHGGGGGGDGGYHGAGGYHGGGSWHGGGGSWHGGGWSHPGYWHGGYGYWGPGAFWGGVGIGLGIGAIGYYGYGYGNPYYGYGYPYPGYAAPGYPGYVVSSGPVPAYAAQSPSGQQATSSSHAPDPIFYPRNKQSVAQTEADRQDCNHWATTQAGAMNDADIFQRATFACMDGRGYTVR